MIAMRFEGGKELAAALAKLPERASRRVQREALREAGEPMRAHMASTAPYDPKTKVHLRDEIVLANARVESGEPAIAIGPSKRVFWGAFQEDGTAFHAAQPFMRPAFDVIAPKSLQILGAALWRELAGRGIRPSMGTASDSVASGPGGSLL